MALLAVRRGFVHDVPRPDAGRHFSGLLLGVAAAVGSLGRWLAALLARPRRRRPGHVRRPALLPNEPRDDRPRQIHRTSSHAHLRRSSRRLTTHHSPLTLSAMFESK